MPPAVASVDHTVTAPEMNFPTVTPAPLFIFILLQHVQHFYT